MRSYDSATQRPMRNNYGSASGTGYRGSPAKKGQKHVVFQLVDPEDPRIQARLPMRVMISQHDTTDSIITTVKNFYGLYEFGVSFENKDGISIIAAYDNFDNDMTVFVRTMAPPPIVKAEDVRDSVPPKKPSLGAPFELRHPLMHRTESPLKTAAHSTEVGSLSPDPEHARRSVSAAPGGKPHLHRTKSKENILGDGDGYSSGDNAEGSVTSSRRSKTEQVNAEISVDNIVEGGRRKRAFESSELPLFVPPQVPMTASISSISPQRRNGPVNAASPYAFSNQLTFAYPQPLPSPQSYGGAPGQFPPRGGITSAYVQTQQYLDQREPRPHFTYPRRTNGGVLPTPDPTNGSVISDEDVALQLMRLGEATGFSHGRTSTSTVDDALSGKADAAMSDDEDDEEDSKANLSLLPHYTLESEGPQQKKQRLMTNMRDDKSEEDDDKDHDDVLRDGFGEGSEGLRKTKITKPSGKPRAISTGKSKAAKPAGQHQIPISPSSLVAPSRKASVSSTINFQHQLAEDEEDLSSKPRCQRCRKSKKGCDRQRPCGRCKDAGVGIDGCVSEDEGNGRKGRYGRHMGVPVKKGEELTASPDVTTARSVNGSQGFFLAPALPDKNRKRKR